MLRLELSEQADADLTEILRYGCATFGNVVGERYLMGFDATFQLLREYPELGPVSLLIPGGIRTRIHGSHRIFYRFDDKRVFVGRILHVSRQIDPELFDD